MPNFHVSEACMVACRRPTFHACDLAAGITYDLYLWCAILACSRRYWARCWRCCVAVLLCMVEREGVLAARYHCRLSRSAG